MPLASTIMDSAASKLNDVNKTMFTYAVQLPYLKSAWNKLQLQLQRHGVTVMSEVSATIDVDANDETIDLPTDFLQPIELKERARDSSELFQPVEERSELPEMEQIDNIIFWTWREEAININPPRTNREVKLDYWKSLNPITSENSNCNVINSLEYLACKTAALCARYIGANITRADSLDNEAFEAQELLLSMEVNRKQSMPVRPRSYGSGNKRNVKFIVEGS